MGLDTTTNSHTLTSMDSISSPSRSDSTLKPFFRTFALICIAYVLSAAALLWLIAAGIQHLLVINHIAFRLW